MHGQNPPSNVEHPRRKRSKARRWIIGTLIFFLAPPLGFIVLQYVGPWGPVPDADPEDALNREHADLNPNAAELYAQALKLLMPPPDGDWGDESGRTCMPLDPEFVAWVDENAAFVEAFRAATRVPDCYFVQNSDLPERDDPVARLRRIGGQFQLLRARLAAQRLDLATFEDAMLLMRAAAVHVSQQPGGVVAFVQGIGWRSMAADRLLLPFQWEGESRTALLAYIGAVMPACEEVGLTDEVWRRERELTVWYLRSQVPTGMRFLAPNGRVCGELDRYLAATREATAAPIETLIDLPSELTEPGQMYVDKPGVLRHLWDVPRVFAACAASSYSLFVELHVRLIAEQRGRRCALAVHKYHLLHGEWPDSMAQAIAPVPLDPLTNAPFIFRRTEHGFTLYSCGLDRDDDGGGAAHSGRFGARHDSAGNRLPPDGDYVFWPLPEPDDSGRIRVAQERLQRKREAAEDTAIEANRQAGSDSTASPPEP